MTALAVVTGLALPSQASAAWNHPLPYEWYVRLAQCETQNDTTHRTRSYVGAFGFARSTWNLFADTPDKYAHRLTFAQQARVLDRAFFFGHTKHDRKQWPVGAYGHGCWKHYWRTSLELRSLVCNNPKQAVRNQCRK